MPTSVFALLTLLMIGWALKEHSQPRGDRSEDTSGSAEGYDDIFIYEVISRTNDSLLSRLDTLNIGIIAIVAGILGFVVFDTDKIFDLDRNLGEFAIACFAVGAFVCLAGYGRESAKPGSIRFPSPRKFVVDFAYDPEVTVSKSIAEAVTNSEIILGVLQFKKWAAFYAFVLLLAGAALSVFARIDGKVLDSRGETQIHKPDSIPRGVPIAQTPCPKNRGRGQYPTTRPR